MLSHSQPYPQQHINPNVHPYIHAPVLYMLNLPLSVTDIDLATLFESCRPFKPTVPRGPEIETAGGGYVNATVEFKILDAAEKALATLQNLPIPNQHEGIYLTLTPFLPTPTNPSPLPPTPSSNSKTRIIKHLPYPYSASQLFDLFRPFGPIYSASILPEPSPNPNSGDNNDDSTGLISFYKEEDGKRAEEEMHCAEVGDRNIAVTVYNPTSSSVTGASTTNNPKRAFHSDISPNAPPFIPSGLGVNPYTPQHTYPTIYQSQSQLPAITPIIPRTSPPVVVSNVPFVHGPGQQVQFAPLHGPGSTSHSGLIDPCNLFCKNLDSDIDSNALFTHFRPFGQIVSARVMRTDSGQSRGFGFVSFQTPDQAASAMHAMNGLVLGSKQLVVRLHEPKQLRQEKLAQRFASSGTSGGTGSGSSSPPSISHGHGQGPGHGQMHYVSLKSRSGATSPDMSILGSEDGYVSVSGYGTGAAGLGAWSPKSRYGSLGAQNQSPRMGGFGDVLGSGNNNNNNSDRPRRSSGSYYHAALSGHLNMPITYEDLSALSPVVRKEVLLGEVTRRVKGLQAAEKKGETEKGGVETNTDIDAVVERLVSMDLEDVVKMLKDESGEELGRGVKSVLSAVTEKEAEKELETEKRLLSASASAPEHPSTPVSLSGSMVISTPARTESPGNGNGNLPTTSTSTSTPSLSQSLSQSQSQTQSEQTRLYSAILALESDSAVASQITELIMGLGKKERAMCLFNREYLKGKVADARAVLESEVDGEGDEGLLASVAVASGKEKEKEVVVEKTVVSSTQPQSQAPPTQIHTLQTLAPLTPVEIYAYLKSLLPHSAHLLPSPLTPPDALITQTTNELIDEFVEKKLSVAQMKQQIGDKLFRLVKGWGVKGAPKVTIMLLDDDENGIGNGDGDVENGLRALALLMNCFPEVLKVKVGLMVERNARSQAQGKK